MEKLDYIMSTEQTAKRFVLAASAARTFINGQEMTIYKGFRHFSKKY